jgi:four helix bundle protein
MRIYQLALEVVASVYRLAAEVQPPDKDLASQMRRACASMVLNLAEGMSSQGGRKVSRYFDSMGSARETVACLHVCVAARLLAQAQVDADLGRLDRIIAGLYRLCHKRSA